MDGITAWKKWEEAIKKFKCTNCGHTERFKTNRDFIDCSKCGMLSKGDNT